MTQFYSTLRAFRFTKHHLFFAFFLAAFYTGGAQTYYVRLSNETPTNVTVGTGSALITIAGNSMRVQASFSGLTGNTTASHIHAATVVAGTGNAGVATTIPTFPGFPSGVKAGTYDSTFDMTRASSYNPAYITANGGTAASAFVALKAAINAGKSYLNIHTNVYPSGEIRGFLTLCPTIMVTIPDAFALPQGTLPNTVYPAYAPASSLSLQATVSGGTGPYSYHWSTGSTSAAITVNPTLNTAYSVEVRDVNGCPGTASKTVNVMDIAGGKKGEKMMVCHNSNSLTIAAPAVAAHLNHGDMLGACSEERSNARLRNGAQVMAAQFSVKALCNPSRGYFDLQLSSQGGTTMQLKVYDLAGRMVENRSSLPSVGTLRLGSSYRPGVYLVQLTQGSQVRTLRLIKTN